MVANLAPEKGQVTLLRALHLLRSRGVSGECWLVGEDRATGAPTEQELRSLCAQLGIVDVVKFLGFRNDIPLLLQAADSLALPSAREGLPLAVLEAQAARVPVIASNVPGILEVVEDSRTGFVVPPDDHQGYADRLQMLWQSEELRQKLVDAAFAHVSKTYAWPLLEERVFAIYRSMLVHKAAVDWDDTN
jgi:glycosyltransferase involved in cell wall biosynthesis